MDRKQIIINLRNKRYTFQNIGRFLGLSKQRIHQIYTGYKSYHKKPYTILEKIPKSVGKNFNSNGIKLQGRDFLKEQVRRRDNYTCQACNKIWEEGKRRLDVHHLDEKQEGKNGYSYENCKNFERQITLCHKCHLNLEHIRKKMSKTIEEKFLG